MMLSREEAVKVVMEELGYKLKQLPDGYLYWSRESGHPVVVNSEEALAHCLDLNVLDGIAEKHSWVMALHPLGASIYSVNHDDDWLIISDMHGNSRKEACFYATAEAIRKEK